jgi:hypothetical protein
MTGLEQLIAAWPKLIASERLAIYSADPEALDLAWNGADDATRKRFAANRRRELKAALAPDLKPVPNGVDVAKQARALRRADPRDPAVRDLADELKGLASFMPHGRLPRGVD